MTSARIVAGAQIGLSIVFLVGYFIMLTLFLLGHIRTPPDWRDQLSILLGVLTAGVTNVLAFWFSRSRSTGEPEKGGVQG